MNQLELAAIARDAIPPVGARLAVATVEHTPGRRLSNGSFAGEGGRTVYRAVWFDGLRNLEPIGPAFDRGRDVSRLIALINGHDRPASRRPPPDPSGDHARDGEPVVAASEAQDGLGIVVDAADPPAPAAISALRLCDGCDRPLPPGGRSNRRCHGPACRAAAFRRRQAAEAKVSASLSAPRSGVTLSGPHGPSAASTAGPASRPAADPVAGTDGSAAARGARPDPDPADPGGPPSLGLIEPS